MQLDNTGVSIRERGLLETMDLALRLIRTMWRPWLITSLMAIVPLAILNFYLIGWMAGSTAYPISYDSDSDERLRAMRFYWNMAVLVTLEAPLASVFTIAYLGPAVFREQKSLRAVAKDVLSYGWTLFLTQGIQRGLAFAWLAYLLIALHSASEFNPLVEVVLMLALLLLAFILRSTRPFINEIVLLERNPMRSRDPRAITVATRSQHLHTPSTSDLFVRWFGSALLAMVLFFATFFSLHGVYRCLKGEIGQSVNEFITLGLGNWYLVQIMFPLALWIVVSFFSVVRFLEYLNLRIRHEGWEVELLIRAEAQRLLAKGHL